MKIRKSLAGLLALAMMISMVTIPVLAVEINQDSFTMKASAPVTVDGTADQTVNVVLSANETMSIVALEGTFSTKEVENTSYIGLTDYESPVKLSGTNYFYTNTGAVVYADADLEGYSVAENGAVMTAVYTVSKDTPTGTYTVQFNATNIQEYDFNQVENAVYTATISVTNTSGEDSTSDYTATIANASTNSTIRVGDTVTVNLGANQAHSASKMTLTYDSSLVTFVSATGCEVNSNTAGTLELASYGAEKATTDCYTLTFTAVSDGNAAFTLTNAAFGTGASAETASLTAATVPSAMNITINKAQHNVTLNQYDGVTIFAGATSVDEGETYTFTPETATGAYYDYTLTAVTMNGTDVLSSVTGDATSGWSIANVTGDLEISGTRTAKTYGVTINTVFGDETSTENKTATYGTVFEFTVPADVAAGTDVGYTYVLTSVTINGQNYTGYSATEGTRDYTIPGADIKGDIVITITKTEQPANTFNVDISGEGAGQVSANPTQVTAGSNVTLTLTPEAGYTYEIKVNGTVVTLDGNNQYTITNVQSADDVTVTVEKNLTLTYASVSNYLQVDGSRFWLVKIAPTDPDVATSTQISGKTYTYNGTNMYWSSAYNAYVTLVVAETAPALTAGDFAIVAVDEVPAITYDMNVNESADGAVDPADAQLVWNMYSVVYNDFTANVTLEKFLKADVNGDGKVDVNDASAIINKVLNLTTN